MKVYHNNIYSDNIYKTVNDENKLLLEDYELELKSRGRAPKTIAQYGYDVRMFFCYIHENMDNKSILDLKKRDFRNFFLFMQETGKSSSRINRVQSSLRNLLQYAEDDDDEYEDYEVNAMRKIKSVEKLEVREIVFLDDEQITFLIDYLIKKDRLQHALYVSLSYDSGGRRNEIFQVEKEGLLDDNVFKTNSVVGKRNKKFSLIFSQRTKDIAKLYLEQRGNDEFSSLWITGNGLDKRLVSYDTLYAYAISFRSILQSEYDEDINLNSHSFRHSCAENLENGSHQMLKQFNRDRLTLNEVRIILNHESADMTQSYMRNKDDEIIDDLFGAK